MSISKISLFQKLTIPKIDLFQKYTFFQKEAFFKIGLFQKLTYLKNEPISKIGLFQKIASAIIIENVTFFRKKKTPQLMETHYILILSVFKCKSRFHMIL